MEDVPRVDAKTTEEEEAVATTVEHEAGQELDKTAGARGRQECCPRGRPRRSRVGSHIDHVMATTTRARAACG
jgi:hypothetical protein